VSVNVIFIQKLNFVINCLRLW